MERIALAGFLLWLLPAAALAAEARLWIFEPSPASDLAGCLDLARLEVSSPTSTARLLATDALVRWGGGQFHLLGSNDGGANGRMPTDKCFALTVDGRIIAAGAVLASYSARRLRVPVLQVPPRGPGEPVEMILAAHFPASLSEPVPEGWRDALSALR
jgi:hypothetical protein